MPHWAEAFVGQPYIPVENDCAELAARIQRERFGRDVNLITERAAGRRALSRQIDTLRDDYGVPVDRPEEGDAVLMRAGGRLSHIGVYCVIQGEPWVLHAMRNVGQVCLHRLRDLPREGLALEGFYRWK